YVMVIFLPSYLNGDDGIFNKSYYDLLIGFDITSFPSYYEPWGYTPLESVAFSIPTITTNLSGFGQWAAQKMKSKGKELNEGVGVINRTDNNYEEMVVEITEMLSEFAMNKATEVAKIRAAAYQISQQALWEKFIVFYKETYTFALAKK
ncbi:MAG: glycosyltransferase, partial [Vallitaleaceae bacterium]|nr:glycosyltransferase [Vallitaleaceae bacterium]